MILVIHDIDVILAFYVFDLIDLNYYWKIHFEYRLE